MPEPMKGEHKKDYIARFMKSGEAQSDFPDEKQRLAVAYSMFEKKNSYPSYGKEFPWPKSYKCTFIEPGVVFYQDLGACTVCGDSFSCGNDVWGDPLCKPEGATVLVRQDALSSMAQSFVGKPVIDMIHKDVDSSTVADGEADGIVTRVWLDEKSGWWMCEFLVWNPETQGHCESPAYSVSCAYDPSETNDSGGEYHNIPYASEILNGEYTHLAVVTNPRYEAARIFVNSKGGRMSWKFWEKGARKNASPIDPSKEMVNVDGEMVPLQNLYDALEEEKPKYNDDTVLETPKGEKTMGELKQAYRNKAKKNAEEKPCPTCGEKKNFGKPGEKTVPGAEGAEPGHSEHREGEIGARPLPDMRDPKQNDSAEEAAKKLDAGAKEKSALELQQAADARDQKDQAEAAAMKNKADAEAKAAEEKKNAEDKAKEEMRQAEEKADKDKEIANRKNSGKKSFADLRNARNAELVGDAAKINPVSMDERLVRGRKKYGSA